MSLSASYLKWVSHWFGCTHCKCILR